MPADEREIERDEARGLSGPIDGRRRICEYGPDEGGQENRYSESGHHSSQPRGHERAHSYSPAQTTIHKKATEEEEAIDGIDRKRCAEEGAKCILPRHMMHYPVTMGKDYSGSEDQSDQRQIVTLRF